MGDIQTEGQPSESNEPTSIPEEKKSLRNIGLSSAIDQILFTAPSIGFNINEVLERLKKLEQFSGKPDLKFKDSISMRIWILKCRGHKNLSTEKRRYAFRQGVLQTERKEVVKKPLKNLPNIPKTDSVGPTYSSPKGVPCKIVTQTKTELKVKSLITGRVISVPVDFPLQKLGGPENEGM